MSQVAELVKEMEDLQNQLNQKKSQLMALKGEIDSVLGTNGTPVATAEVAYTGKKRGPKPGSKKTGAKRGPKPRKEDGSKTLTAHEAVKAILKKHRNGLKLTDIRKELEEMRKKGEFQSKAQNLSSIVSQALDKLKGVKEVTRNLETACWLAVS